MLDDPGDQTNLDGDPAAVDLFAVSAYNNTLSYSASGLPNGLSIDSSTGLISGIVADSALSGSPFSVSVTASDGTNSDTESFTWTINPLIVFTTPGSQTNQVGDVVNMPLTVTDANENPLSFSASGLPSGLIINAATGFISGTIASGANSGSPYDVSVTATDSTESVSATLSFNWTVNAQIVSLTNPGFQANVEGDSVSLSLTSSDADSNALSFTAAGLPSGLSINSSTGAITGTVASGDGSDTPYTVTVTATDSTAGISTVQKFNWIIEPTTVVEMEMARFGTAEDFDTLLSPSVTPTMLVYAEVLPGQEVKVFGRVIDANPAGVTVTLSGAVSATTTTDSVGFFSYMTTSASLGTVSAVGVDSGSNTTNTSTATVSDDTPVLTMFFTAFNGNNVTLSGNLRDIDPGSVTVTFGGVGTGTTTTNADGSFSFTTTLSAFGSMTASIVNVWLQNATTTLLLAQQPAPAANVYTVTNLAGDVQGTRLQGTLAYCVNQINRSAASQQFQINFRDGLRGPIRLRNQLVVSLGHKIIFNGTVGGMGANPQQNIIITRDSTAPNPNFGILWFQSDTNCSMINLIVRGGRATQTGGFIYAGGIGNSGTLFLRNDQILDNQAQSGGGIANSGYLTLNFCLVKDNQAVGGRESAKGGGIWNRNGAGLIIQNSTWIDRNSSANDGGGIYSASRNAAVLIQSNSRVYLNQASSGGGIAIEGGLLIMVNSRLITNSAGSGAGLDVLYGGNVLFSDCLLQGNTATNHGGAIYLGAHCCPVQQMTFSHNPLL